MLKNILGSLEHTGKNKKTIENLHKELIALKPRGNFDIFLVCLTVILKSHWSEHPLWWYTLFLTVRKLKKSSSKIFKVSGFHQFKAIYTKGFCEGKLYLAPITEQVT